MNFSTEHKFPFICQCMYQLQASVTLYLDELAEFYSLDIQCRFLLYVDSTSAISNVQQLRDLIPKRRFSDNADILTTLSAAHPVIR